MFHPSFIYGQNFVSIRNSFIQSFRFSVASVRDSSGFKSDLTQILLVVGIIKMMSLLVSMQIRFLVESLVAARVRATEGFFTSVNPEMCFQVKI